MEGAALMRQFNAETQRRGGAEQRRGGLCAIVPWRVIFFPIIAVCATLHFPFSVCAADRASVLVVVGAAGEKDFEEQFEEWAGRWKKAAEKAGAEFAVIGLDEAHGKTDRELLAERLRTWSAPSEEVAWLVFIGHGTFDGKTAKCSSASLVWPFAFSNSPRLLCASDFLGLSTSARLKYDLARSGLPVYIANIPF